MHSPRRWAAGAALLAVAASAHRLSTAQPDLLGVHGAGRARGGAKGPPLGPAVPTAVLGRSGGRGRSDSAGSGGHHCRQWARGRVPGAEQGTASPVSGAWRRVAACIAESLELLEGKAAYYLEALDKPPKRGPVHVLGLAMMDGPPMSPCTHVIDNSSMEEQRAGEDTFLAFQCARELEQIWRETWDDRWVLGCRGLRNSLVLALARISEVLPPVSKALLARVSPTDPRMLRSACTMSRLEYCYAILDWPYTEGRDSTTRRHAANTLGTWLLAHCSFVDEDDAADCEWGRLYLPSTATALLEWYQGSCDQEGTLVSKTLSEQCRQTMDVVVRLCFLEQLQGEEPLMEICTAGFAMFASPPGAATPLK